MHVFAALITLGIPNVRALRTNAILFKFTLSFVIFGLYSTEPVGQAKNSLSVNERRLHPPATYYICGLIAQANPLFSDEEPFFLHS